MSRPGGAWPLVDRLTRGGSFAAVVAGGLLLLAGSDLAPPAVLAALAGASWTLGAAWRRAAGTALRPALAWGFAAVALGAAVEVAAWFEPAAGGRPVAGHLAYLCTLFGLAALTSVLNARTPGGGAWAVLMALMVVVFLIPWLEGAGLGRGAGALARLRLDNPWTIFYWLVVLAGVTNYLPTRYGPAVAWLALGFLLEYLALTRAVGSNAGRARVWAAVPWTLAAAAWTADLRGRVSRPPTGRLEGLWFWFRDHWGVVWALRVMERVNRTAESQGWPVRLAWHGVVAAPGADAAGAPGGADDVLKGLLRRFASAGRLDRAARGAESSPCQRPDAT